MEENRNRVGMVLLLLAGFVLVLCVGMAIGGAVVYGVMRLGDVLPWARTATIDLPSTDLPGRPSVRVLTPGAVITEVVPDSPAERAGLQSGDVIQAVDGQQVGLEKDLAALIAEYEPGDRLTLEVQRPGEEAREVRVKLGEHPEKDGVAYLGVTYSSSLRFQSPDLEPFDLDEFDLDDLPFTLPRGRAVQGVIVSRVAEDSPAAAAGLRAGDVIAAIDGEPLGSAQALTDAIAEREPGDRVTLSVFRAGAAGEREIEVKLGEHPDQDGKAYLGVWPGGSLRFHFYTPDSEGGALPPGFESRQGFFFGLPSGEFRLDELPWDKLPFDLEDLPFDWGEFQREFEFRWPPGDDCDGQPGCSEDSL